MIEDITRKGTAVFKNIDFSDVLKVKAEVSTGDLAGGKVKLCYGDGGPQVAEVVSVKTNSLNSFKDCIGEYTGTSGGYCGTEDLYLSFEANQEEFSVTKYKEKLDSADVIIAYAGTNLSDSAESYDRKKHRLAFEPVACSGFNISVSGKNYSRNANSRASKC